MSSHTARIQALANVAEELRQGACFRVTRLTRIKSLCENSDAASRFALYIARCAQQNILNSDVATIIGEEKLILYRELVVQAVECMEMIVEQGREEILPELTTLFYELQQQQNTHKKLYWGAVRHIEYKDALVVELACNCIIDKSHFAWWAYELAQQYAEQYNPKYGNGLLPESAPMVESIVNFWQQYYEENPDI